jgi:hypothetical protein
MCCSCFSCGSQADPSIGKLIQLAQIAALGSHPYVLEYRPELPRTSEIHAEEEGMYWRGYVSKVACRFAARGLDNQEGQEAKFQHRGYNQVLRVLFRRTPGSYQRDYYTSANHEGLQGVKDP